MPAIEQEAYPDPWTQGMFEQELQNGASHFYVGLAGDQLAAYGGFWLIVDEAHITKVTVSHEHRGHGYGAALVGHLLSECRALGVYVVRLEVREQNAVAQRLYSRFGFQEVGRRRGYYARTNETAVVMTCML
ncbi:MAG: ribosomal protein S18-alanine N-acetyltransferase [Candidatus Hydrogenedentes bacterium]|nr:ribosomal protein S18-alanine N-acetyltransferase [Candidatus Hydrogenedentota bacterium]